MYVIYRSNVKVVYTKYIYSRIFGGVRVSNLFSFLCCPMMCYIYISVHCNVTVLFIVNVFTSINNLTLNYTTRCSPHKFDCRYSLTFICLLYSISCQFFWIIYFWLPVLHTHFSGEYILVFPPERSVYTHFSPQKDQYILIFPPRVSDRNVLNNDFVSITCRLLDSTIHCRWMRSS